MRQIFMVSNTPKKREIKNTMIEKSVVVDEAVKAGKKSLREETETEKRQRKRKLASPIDITLRFA